MIKNRLLDVYTTLAVVHLVRFAVQYTEKMTVVTFTLSAGCADLHLLDMLTPMERKRQGYIHELIVTEENYVNDLQLVTEVRSDTSVWAVCRNSILNVAPNQLVN